MADVIRVDRHDGVATVSLNRPDRLNALNRPVWPALTEAFEALSADPSVRCVVLRGAGKAFSPGADISEFESERPDAARASAYGQVMERAYAAVEGCPHPTVARIQGPCTGAGMVLALLCDLRITGAGGKFGAPVARIGLAMPLPEFRVLFAAVGRARALELVLEAKVIDADEAARIGLVHRVVPDDALDQEIEATTRRITAGAPLVARAHKAFARRLATGAPLSPDELAASYASFDTADYREGIQAFLDKRPPGFRGE